MVVSSAAVSVPITRPDHPSRDLDADVLTQDGAHETRLEQLTTVGDRADRCSHLEWRHPDLIAHRHRREGAIVQPGQIVDEASTLAREVG